MMSGLSLNFSSKFLVLFFISSIIISGCKNVPEPCVPDNFLYYSDYFVFVADDGGAPLVIPIDANWTPGSSGFSLELKGWHGTTEEWPIAYSLDEISMDLCEIPQESWEHADTEYFQFSKKSREIITTIWGAPELRLGIPEAPEWVKAPIEGTIEIFGCKTTAQVDGDTRSGWLIYERIRRSVIGGSFGDFEMFFWIPVIVDNAFYLFEQHRGKQEAYRWLDNEGVITVSSIEKFEMNIDGTSIDSTSGRTNIPETITIKAPEWGINIQLTSGGSQVGYGPEFPNGLAYYRQSLMQSTLNSTTKGYGMLELILEDD